MTQKMGWGSALALSIALAIGGTMSACGGSRSPIPSGDTDAGAGVPDAGPASLYEPAAPASPATMACPSGTRALVLPSGASVCEVDPDAAPCDDASARFVGAPDCAPVGDACPAGSFPDVPTDVPARYVLAGAAAGGDGSMASPFATIREGLRGATSGTTVVIGKGVYAESNLNVPAGVRVLGACVAETSVTAGGIAAPVPLMRVATRDAVIEQLTLGPSSALGLQVEGGALTVHDVVVRDATTAGVSVLRGTLSGDHLVVRRTAIDPGFGDAGWGMFVEAGGIVDLDTLVVEESGEHGVLAVMTANVTLRGVAVRNSRGSRVGEIGGGIHAQDGATVEIDGAVITGNPMGGIASWDGAHVVARDVAIADVQGVSTTQIVGFGVSVDTGSEAELERVTIAHTSRTSILVRDGSTLRASDVVVHDSPAGLGGRGDVTLTANRVVLDGVANGTLLQGPGVSAELTDLVVNATVLTSGRMGGFGITINHGGSLVLARARIVDTMVIGVAADDADTMVTASDLLVTGTRGYGPDEQWGQGLSANGTAQVTVTRARFEGNREVQVAAFAAGTRVELNEVVFRRSLPRACEPTSCHDVAGGSSLGAYGGAAVVARRFEIDDARLCGLQVATDGALDAIDGVVRRAAIGACVQVPAYDLSRVTSTVTYENNGINVDTMDLPVPMPLEDLDSLGI